MKKILTFTAIFYENFYKIKDWELEEWHYRFKLYEDKNLAISDMDFMLASKAYIKKIYTAKPVKKTWKEYDEKNNSSD